MTTEYDPPDLDAYNDKGYKNQHIEGWGFDVTTYLPCPGCSEPDFLAFPITAGMTDDYAQIQQPTMCGFCGRTFQFVVDRPDDSTMLTHIEFISGDPLPPYLEGLIAVH